MSALQPLIDLLPSSVAPKLDQGLADLGVSVTTTQREQLLGLLALLHKWNRAYNLTAVRDVEEMVSRHVLDSAAVAPYIHGPELLDVGAGARPAGLGTGHHEPGASGNAVG